MKLVVHNLRTEVQATREEHMWLYDSLSFPDGKARFIRNYRGDGKVHLYDRTGKHFPGGFTAQVVGAAKAFGIPVTVTDARTCPCVADPDADLDWLRDYQLKGVEKVEKRTRGILWMPTGSGKTEVAVGLAVKLPCTWLFVVHSKDLLFQTAERFEKRTGLKAGIIGEGRWEVERFTVATFQTLYAAIKTKNHANHKAALDLLGRVQGLIVDEAHTLAADTFWKISMLTRSAYYRVGMSGTPLARGDRRSMLTVGALGSVIYRIMPRELIDRGLLAEPEIKMVAVEQGPDTFEGDRMHTESSFASNWSNEPSTFQGIYGKYIVRSAARNRAITEAVKVAAKPCLVFVKQVNHGKLLNERFSKAGIRSEFVWGDKNTAKRKAAIERLVRNEVDVLVCSVIFQEGIDIPELLAIVNAAGGKSVIATIQKMGRGSRPSKGKNNKFEVWDIWDVGNKILERHAKGRKKAYESEGYEVTLVDLLSKAAA